MTTTANAGAAELRRTRPRFIARFAGAIAVVLLVAGAGLAAKSSAGFTSFEIGILQFFSDTHSAPFTALASGIDWLFGPPIAIVIILAVAAIILWTTRLWRTAIHFVILVAGSWLGSEVIKLVVQRPRPDPALLPHPPLVDPNSFSFPSGHSCFAASLGLALIVLALRSRARWVVVVGAIVVALLTAWSRVYIGVHYPSDVIASLVYSTAAVIALEILWRRYSVLVPRSG